MNDWLVENLVCPRDHQPLQLSSKLSCPLGHIYPYIDNIPVMLVEEEAATHHACVDSLEMVGSGEPLPPDNWEDGQDPVVHPYVQKAIAGTCGYMYIPVMNHLSRYPIPRMRLPLGDGKMLLDIGCNWGRWSISAAQSGYHVVGIDPSIDAIRAANAVAGQCGVDAIFVVGDARHLPFRSQCFDIVFSYSVLQHFSRGDVEKTLEETARVLRMHGSSLIQMLNSFGLRNLYHQTRRGFRREKDFEVRYWSPAELEHAFRKHIGPTTLWVDGFFSANVQTTDLDLLPRRFRPVIYTSEILRKLSEKIPGMKSFADSLYVRSERAVL